MQNRHRLYTWSWAWAPLSAVFILIVLWVVGFRDGSVLVSIVGAFLAGAYFMQRQRLEEVRLFKDLFTDFNERYDNLNEALNGILERPNGTPLAAQDVHVLYDYFNLCAEEYLFFNQGYIPRTVWNAWTHGMAIYAADDRVRALWLKELETGSYYGFPSKLIADAPDRR